jgi:hypothetical protein
MNYFKIMLPMSIMIIILFGVNQLYSQPGITPPDCYNELEDCGTWSSTNPELERAIEITGYPGCVLTVKYRIRECDDPSCPGNTIKEIYIYEVYFNYGDSACAILESSLWDDYPNHTRPNYFVFASLYIEAYRQLARTLFWEFYQNNQNQQQYHCLEPNCIPGPCSPGKIMFYLPECTSVCWWKYNQAHMRYNTCVGEDLQCCKYTESFCYCVSTQTLMVLEDYETVMANCDFHTPPQGGCPEVQLYYGFELDCYSLCQP